MIKPQYLAHISKSSVFAFLFAQPSGVYAIEAVTGDLDLKFSIFGNADFNERERVVKNMEFTDAALVSNDIILPVGFYKLDAMLDWDVVAENESINAAHVSLHGVKILAPIKTSRGLNTRVSAYFDSDGEPFKISFGLGGFAKGKGFVRLQELKISHIKKSSLKN